MLSPPLHLKKRAEQLYFSDQKKSINLYIKSVFAYIKSFEFKECTLDTYISLHEYVKEIVKRSMGRYKDILKIIECSVAYCLMVKRAKNCVDEGIVCENLDIDLIKLDNMVENRVTLVKLECLTEYIFSNYEFE